MKDAFGGTFMLYILLFFLAVYIIFIAMTLNYAKAFKAKNKIVDIIEKYEGENCQTENEALPSYEDTCFSEIDEVKNSYSHDIIKGNEISSISLKLNKNKSNNTCYYTVNVAIPWKFPIFNIEGSWYIKGETRNVIYCDEGV